MLKIRLTKRSLYILGFIGLYLLNILSTQYNSIGILVAGLLWIYVIFCFFSKQYETAFIAIIVGIATSFEVNSFVYYNQPDRPLYSIFVLPFVSYAPFYLSLYFLFIVTVVKYQNINDVYTPRVLNRVKRYIIWFCISGFIMGLLTWMVNDNNVQLTSWYIGDFIRVTLQSTAMFCIIGTTDNFIRHDRKFYVRLSSTLESLLVAAAICSLISGLVGLHGFYGANPNILLMPLSVSLCPLLIVFPFYNKSGEHKWLYTILGILFLVESVKYSSLMGSKFYVIPLFVIVVCFVKSANRQYGFRFLILLIILLIALAFSGSLISILTSSSTYNEWKWTQLIELFDFSEGGILQWYNNVATSPRYRIEELINIFLEFVHKPLYFIFGKGNAGTITHLWGNLDWNTFLGNFPKEQINSRIYRSMHESLNILFLRHGIPGVAFLVDVVISLFKRFTTSKWAIAGLIWVLFYWGAYQSWWVGAVMFVLALYEDKYVIQSMNEEVIS